MLHMSLFQHDFEELNVLSTTLNLHILSEILNNQRYRISNH